LIVRNVRRPAGSSCFPTAGHCIAEAPARCVVCGCHDLWRQKDFPQGLGLFFVALGALISTIAWAYHMPLTALGTLMGFAALDLLLYVFMPDVLVCYRCHARYRHAALNAAHPRFNLETAERYRQEAARLADSRAAADDPLTAKGR
jgi:hypothetical protein